MKLKVINQYKINNKIVPVGTILEVDEKMYERIKEYVLPCEVQNKKNKKKGGK